MGTSRTTIDDVLERLAPLNVRARAMFGEYALYCDEKVVALVCDDRVFLKVTDAPGDAPGDTGDEGSEADPLERGAPFPGAKDHLILHDGWMMDGDRFRAVVQGTADRLPLPKKRKPKKKARG